MDAFQDAAKAVHLVLQRTWQRELTAWLYVPVGVVVALLACFAVDKLIGLSSISFPASVAMMIVLLLLLLLSQTMLGDKRTRAILAIVDIPCGFALRWISILFTPSFVTLPLSPSISGIEIGKIIGIFLIGFFAMFTLSAYFVRGLLSLLGSSKRAITERAEEMGDENDVIPLADSSNSLPTRDGNDGDGLEDLMAPDPAQDPNAIRTSRGPPAHQDQSSPANTTRPTQLSAPLNREQIWATHISAHMDIYTYATLFIFVGLPVYYSIDYPMPAQLCLNVLAYFLALSLPPSWKRFLHPVLVSSALTIVGIWILALTRRHSLQVGLRAYSTKTKYLQLWDGEKGLRMPGAGDIFSSVLDVSIIALALPMFQYRIELRRHIAMILIPLLPLVGLSMFGYPAFCAKLLGDPKHSLSFTSRSLTLALATPTTQNLDGDTSLVAVLCIMSGILGVLFGSTLFEWLNIPEDDYVTRGITLGANSSAIATALLLTTDPRAAALSSLSMSLFGTVMVALSSIPPAVQIVQRLANL